jgi:hypothetical protein
MPAAGRHFNVNCELFLSAAKGLNRTSKLPPWRARLLTPPRTAVGSCGHEALRPYCHFVSV